MWVEGLMVIVGNEDLLWQQVLEQHVDVVGEEDLLEQQVVGEVDHHDGGGDTVLSLFY